LNLQRFSFQTLDLAATHPAAAATPATTVATTATTAAAASGSCRSIVKISVQIPLMNMGLNIALPIAT
jgi:hypothetical protein